MLLDYRYCAEVSVLLNTERRLKTELSTMHCELLTVTNENS